MAPLIFSTNCTIEYLAHLSAACAEYFEHGNITIINSDMGSCRISGVDGVIWIQSILQERYGRLDIWASRGGMKKGFAIVWIAFKPLLFGQLL